MSKYVHSYTALANYQQCPRKFEALNLLKTHKEPPSAATEEGKKVHEELEKYISGVRRVVPERLPADNLVETLKSARAKVEVPLGITKDGRPCGFFDRGVYLRGKLDVLLDTGKRLIAIDWKTGKVKAHDLQAKVYGLMLSVCYPNRPTQVVFDFLEKGRLPPHVITPADAAEARDLLEEVDGAMNFPPRPSGLCGWCPVTTCEYWRDRNGNN